MSQHLSPEITEFVAELCRQGVASKTVDAYTTDLTGFVRWFADSKGEAFSTRAVNPTDLLDYKAHLRTPLLTRVRRRRAAQLAPGDRAATR